MADPGDDIDAALTTAVDRVREAEVQFLETQTGTRRAVDHAGVVERRAEDLDELASDLRAARDAPVFREPGGGEQARP